MTLVAITQRVAADPATGERRDALDRRWHAFLAAAGLVALPMPNDAAAALVLIEAVDPAGVVLSGGGDLAVFGGDADDRDATEAALLGWADRRRKPVVGVCRGMQQIVHLGGGRIERLDGHVRERHRLRFRGRSVSVNSFHELAVTAVPERDFEVLARAPGGTIEAVRHRTLRRTGIMWHPEREQPFADHDLALFRQAFLPVPIQGRMRGLILAAGRGSRMHAATADRPKALVELDGIPLLDWQLAALHGAGIQEIALVRGYRGEAFEGRGLTLFDNPHWAETNMVASLATAADWLSTGPCIVSYADIFYPAEAVRRLMAAEGDVVLGYDPAWLDLWSRRFADPLGDAETFRIDGQGRVLEIGGKAGRTQDIEGQYVGLFRLMPAGWARIAAYLQGCDPATRAKLDVTALLARLIASGVAVHGVPIPGPWGEVDQPGDLAVYEKMIVEGALRRPQP